MKGNIYTRQKCWICEGQLIHDEKRGGCFCETHPQVEATKGFYVKFGREVNRRKETYEKAIRYLTGLRYEVDHNKFDVRDHQASNPLGFSNLGESYLTFKKRKNLASYHHIERFMVHAIRHFKDSNVKYIRKKDLSEYLYGIRGISEKTRANHASVLHDFYYNYLYEYEEILSLADLPKFPNIPYELGFRKITDLDTREKIVNRIKERTYTRNPKVWLAIDILCTYNQLRPGDIIRLQEGDIDLEYGVLTFWRPTKSKKNKKPKVIRIRLLEYHLEEFKKLKIRYRAVDSMPFFRHPSGLSGVTGDRPFHTSYLYKQWKKAAIDLGVVDLDLYGGTRHTSVTALAKEVGREKARKHSGHGTNKAFDRYCQIGDDDNFDIAQIVARMRGKIVEIKKREKG